MSKYTSEKAVAEALIAAALAKGYFVSVFADDEELALSWSKDQAKILASLGSAEMDALHFYQSTEEKTVWVGWMLLVWGNYEHGLELIADYTDNEAMNALVDAVDADAD